MTTVEIPGRGIVQFPASMSQEDIAEAIKKLSDEDLPKKTGKPQKVFHPAETLEAFWSLGRDVFAATAGGLHGLATLPKGIEAAAEAQRSTTEKFAHEPGSELAKELKGDIVELGEDATKLARKPISGLRMLAGLPGGVDNAVAAGKRIEEEGIGATAGDAVMSITGNPELATAVHTAPDAIASILGTKGAGRVPKIKIPEDTAKVPDVVSQVRKQKLDVLDSLDPDPDVIEAARRLNGPSLNPEHYASNAQFQEIARAVKAKAGSQLEANERAALENLSVQAEKLLDDMDAQTDKAVLDLEIGKEFSDAIAAMEIQAEALYARVDKVIPKATQIEAQNVRGYLKTRLGDLGGDRSLLTTAEKKLLKLIDTDTNPTYGALDAIRKDVGSGFNRRSGPFKDDNTGTLKQVYAALSEDQQAAASFFGAEDVYASARSIVAKRKGIEDDAVELFGRDLSGSLVPRIRSASTALTKGDMSRFNKLMEALPDGRRPEVAAAIIDDLMGAGSRTNNGLSQGFVPAFAALNRHKTAKAALFKYLPEGVQQRFDDIGVLLTAIVKSNQKPLSNPSGSAAPIVAALEKGSAIEKIYNGGKIALAEGVSTSAGFPGAGTAAAITRIVSKEKTPAIEAADKFLASERFKKAMNQALNGDVTRAHGTLESSRAFQQWVGHLDQKTVQEIAALGFFGWLVTNEENADERN